MYFLCNVGYGDPYHLLPGKGRIDYMKLQLYILE